MQQLKDTNTRILLAVFLGAILFAGGYHLGASANGNNENFDGPVSGVLNVEQPTTTLAGVASPTSTQEIKTCVDNKGANVPCLIERDKISNQSDAPADFSQFWKVWNVINEKYVPTKHAAISNQEKVWGAIAGLANSLGDPYTYFLPPQEKTLFEQQVSGSFGGVGMQIGMKDGLVTVIAPLKGSPAEKAGIKKGDKVLNIDGATN